MKLASLGLFVGAGLILANPDAGYYQQQQQQQQQQQYQQQQQQQEQVHLQKRYNLHQGYNMYGSYGYPQFPRQFTAPPPPYQPFMRPPIAAPVAPMPFRPMSQFRQFPMKGGMAFQGRVFKRSDEPQQQVNQPQQPANQQPANQAYATQPQGSQAQGQGQPQYATMQYPFNLYPTN